ncbi:hypothetical protein LINPERPRIM_LOCUS19733, partial [Linum perenne]
MTTTTMMTTTRKRTKMMVPATKTKKMALATEARITTIQRMKNPRSMEKVEVTMMRMKRTRMTMTTMMMMTRMRRRMTRRMWTRTMMMTRFLSHQPRRGNENEEEEEDLQICLHLSLLLLLIVHYNSEDSMLLCEHVSKYRCSSVKVLLILCSSESLVHGETGYMIGGFGELKNTVVGSSCCRK